MVGSRFYGYGGGLLGRRIRRSTARDISETRRTNGTIVRNNGLTARVGRKKKLPEHVVSPEQEMMITGYCTSYLQHLQYVSVYSHCASEPTFLVS